MVIERGDLSIFLISETEKVWRVLHTGGALHRRFEGTKSRNEYKNGSKAFRNSTLYHSISS